MQAGADPQDHCPTPNRAMSSREVPGTDPKALVSSSIGGHLDSWDLGTGAIDDGAGVAITTAAAKRLLDGPRPRRTIRVVWFGAEEPGGFGGEAYAKAHANGEVRAGLRIAISARTMSGASTVNLPDSAKAVGDRLGVALAPLGIVRRARTSRAAAPMSSPILKFALGPSAVDAGPGRHALFRLAPHARGYARQDRPRTSCARTSRRGRRCCGSSPTRPRIGTR